MESPEDLKLPKGIKSGVISDIQELIKALESGLPIKGTRVTREETPDGPLHTFEEVEIIQVDNSKNET